MFLWHRMWTTNGFLESRPKPCFSRGPRLLDRFSVLKKAAPSKPQRFEAKDRPRVELMGFQKKSARNSTCFGEVFGWSSWTVYYLILMVRRSRCST